MSDESQLQVRPKGGDSSLVLSSARSNLVARGRRDSAVLAVPCNKCGERKELAFAGCVCADCSDAFDMQWAGSTATDWLVTRPSDSSSVGDFVFLNTKYAEMKKYGWAANDQDSHFRGFFRYRQAAPEEIAQLKSQWGTWSRFSGARVVRPATPEEVVAHVQSSREWYLAGETDRIINDTCDRIGFISGREWWRTDPESGKQIAERDEPHRFEQAAEEIAGRIRELGWHEELVRMQREECDALQSMDNQQLLEIVLQKAADGSL